MMKKLLGYALMGAAAIAVAYTTAATATSKTLTEDDVVAIVKRVIKDQPELIVDSLQSMRERETANQATRQKEAIAMNKTALLKNPLSPFIGNPNGDVVVVEFFDYHCGYCKRMLPVMQELVKQDKKVKVIFKEFPIFGEDSENAAKSALAINKIAPKKYFDYHAKLMNHQGSYDTASLEAYAKELGVDMDDFRKAKGSEEVSSYLNEVKKLGSDLGIQGTPAMIIGDGFFPGALDLDALKANIEKARK